MTVLKAMRLSWYMVLALSAGIVSGSATALLFRIETVISASMTPTLRPKQHILTFQSSPIPSMW
ncbi:MAG TPA: hypothetical protein VGX03_27420, partial [Candidatus Binatia bacterium]|nr:hypothetical protein [Candidatus Binatia bacterium]